MSKKFLFTIILFTLSICAFGEVIPTSIPGSQPGKGLEGGKEIIESFGQENLGDAPKTIVLKVKSNNPSECPAQLQVDLQPYYDEQNGAKEIGRTGIGQFSNIAKNFSNEPNISPNKQVPTIAIWKAQLKPPYKNCQGTAVWVYGDDTSEIESKTFSGLFQDGIFVFKIDVTTMSADGRIGIIKKQTINFDLPMFYWASKP